MKPRKRKSALAKPARCRPPKPRRARKPKRPRMTERDVIAESRRIGGIPKWPD